MSKSLKRVTQALQDADIAVAPIEMAAETRTAQQAADAAACHVDQIAKSVIFMGEVTGQVHLFITAGSNRVDHRKASSVAGQPLGKADAGVIRAQTGFAIGGVAPIGHLNPIPAFLDPRLLDFGLIYAAAGTPRHIFPIEPHKLLLISGAQTADFTTNSE